MGEGIIEAEITRWLVKEGHAVEAGEPLVEIATDKVDTEIPAPVSGTVYKIFVSEGEVSKIGQVIAVLSTDATVASELPAQEETGPDALIRTDGSINLQPVHTEKQAERKSREISENERYNITAHSHHLAETAFLSPVVRKMAREHMLNHQEIAGIQGSGVGGRITRRDIEDYLDTRAAAAPQSPPPPDHPAEKLQDDTHTRTVMDRMRQKIADHMVYSKKTAPHVTSFIESDVTVMMDWRNRVKDDFEAKYGQKLTVTALVIEAVIKALKEFQDINVSVDGHTVIHKKELNIGLATALPDGNLIVPVIREADKLNLAGLAGRVNDLAERARNNSLKPEEVTGGTFTVTNLGNFGNLAGTPIINQPEAAILAVGIIRKMPAVVATPQGDAIGIRQLVILSLAYDHRTVDGALGGSFLRSIGDHLQHFDNKRNI